MREIEFLGLEECPRCGEYSVATYFKLVPDTDKNPSGWRKILPWNWTGREFKTYEIEQCKDCRKTVEIVEVDYE